MSQPVATRGLTPSDCSQSKMEKVHKEATELLDKIMAYFYENRMFVNAFKMFIFFQEVSFNIILPICLCLYVMPCFEICKPKLCTHFPLAKHVHRVEFYQIQHQMISWLCISVQPFLISPLLIHVFNENEKFFALYLVKQYLHNL
jgi:hypothetical protein